MFSDIDAARGLVILDGEAFEAVTTDAAPDLSAALAEVPGITEALAAYAEPLVRWRVDRAAGTDRLMHFGWLGEDVAASLLAGAGETVQLIATPPQFLAYGLARVLGLGPRPGPAYDVVPVDESVVDALLGDDGDEREAALAGIDAEVLWTFAVESEEDSLTMAILDSARGYRLLEQRERGGFVLTPTTPSELWLRLARILTLLEVPEARVSA